MYNDDLRGPSLSHHFVHWRVLGLCVGMVLGIAVVFIGTTFHLSGGIAGMASAAAMPADLREGVFVANGRMYTVEPAWFSAKSHPVFDRRAAHSPSDDRIIHAFPENPTANTDAILPGTWKVEIVREGRANEYVVDGYGPAFLDENTIVYFSEMGIVTHSFASGESKVLYRFEAAQELGSIVQYSPDRTMVLWSDGKTGQTYLGRITATSYETFRVFDLPYPLKLTNAAVYELRPSSEGAQIWRHGFNSGEPTKVITIPPALGIVAVL